MKNQRRAGTILMAIAAIQALVFTFGVMRRSYLAIALPVLAAVATISGLLFWVGYTLSTMKPGLSNLDMEEEVEVTKTFAEV